MSRLNFDLISEQIDRVEAKAALDCGRLEEIRQEKCEKDAKIAEMEKDRQVKQNVLDLLSEIVQRKRDANRKSVEGMVTHAMDVVFGKELSFLLKSETKQGQPSFRVALKDKETGEEMDPIHSHGGGVAQVVAFVLRVIAVMMAKPGVNRFIALDESFNAVSKNYRPQIMAFLRELVDSADFKILMVTHDDESFLENADDIYRIENHKAVLTGAEGIP